MAAAHDMLNAANWNNAGPGHFGFSVEGFTNLAIGYAGPGTGAGTIRLGNNTDAPTAYSYYPDTGVTGGDVWFGHSGRTRSPATTTTTPSSTSSATRSA